MKKRQKHEGSLRELHCLLGKAQGLSCLCIDITEEGAEDGARLFSLMLSNRARRNGHQLKYRKFQVSIRKHFLTVRVTERMHRLPGEVVESLSMEIFKNHLDIVLVNLIYIDLLKQVVISYDLQKSLPNSTVL